MIPPSFLSLWRAAGEKLLSSGCGLPVVSRKALAPGPPRTRRKYMGAQASLGRDDTPRYSVKMDHRIVRWGGEGGEGAVDGLWC